MYTKERAKFECCVTPVLETSLFKKRDCGREEGLIFIGK